MSTSAPTVPGPQPVEQLMRAATGYMASISLYIAAKLGIADLLANGPVHVGSLAAQTSVHPERLYRVLRALASTGIFTETASGTFDLTPAAELLRSDVPGSSRAMAIWICDPFHLRLFSELPHSVQTGETTIEHVFGKAAFEYFASDPAEAEAFNAAMTSFSRTTVPAILEAYDFSSVGTLVDVGGGHGYLLCSVLEKYPAMRGMVVELESVAPGAQASIAARGLSDRCNAVAGDIFARIPAGGDAYIMKHILHDWNDERAVAILTNCRKALEGKPNGKVLVADAIITPGNEPHPAKFIDLEMMVFCGSKERTEQEFRELFAAAGFRLTRVIPTRSPTCLLEAVPQ